VAIAEALLTAEEYRLLPDNGQPTELVRGRIVTMNMPAPRHGYYCSLIVEFLGPFVRERQLGRVMSNDSGVVTERGPDTVRGADICYYSFRRLPQGELPDGYVDAVPEVVFEVRSAWDRWPRILVKVGEYLSAGVLVVCVHDVYSHTLTVYRPEQPPQVLGEDDELTLPEVHADFRVAVRRLFE
jgi:Uma2 family endonuclease